LSITRCASELNYTVFIGEQMAHSFTVKLSDEVFSVLKKVKTLIAEHGGKFEGNTKRGGDSF
jgi:hypothetical protein